MYKTGGIQSVVHLRCLFSQWGIKHIQTDLACRHLTDFYQQVWLRNVLTWRYVIDRKPAGESGKDLKSDWMFYLTRIFPVFDALTLGNEILNTEKCHILRLD